MTVCLEYMGFFKIEGVPSGTALTMAPDTTVEALLDRLAVKQSHRKYLVPLVNRERKAFDFRLRDGDVLFLYFPVGGG